MARQGYRGPLKRAPARREPSNPLRVGDGGMPSLKDAPNPRHVPNPRCTLHLSPSPKGGLKPQHPLRVAGKCRPQLPPPLRQPNRPPPREMATKKLPWTPLRHAHEMEKPSLINGGSLAHSMMKALICPKVRGGRRTTPPSSGTISEGITPIYPWPNSGRFMNQSSGIWGPAGSFGPCSRRRTPCS